MSALAARIRAWYGARPLHLLALIAAFALAGYAVHAVQAAGQLPGFALWFAVAIIGHDLLLFPLYALADLSVRRLLPGRLLPGRPGLPGRSGLRAGRADSADRAVGHDLEGSCAAGDGNPSGSWKRGRPPPVINYVRVPAAFALLLLLVWFPLILRLSVSYGRLSGLSTEPYLWRWLGVTGAVFTISAISYAIALRRAAAPRPGPGRPGRDRPGRSRSGRNPG